MREEAPSSDSLGEYLGSTTGFRPLVLPVPTLRRQATVPSPEREIMSHRLSASSRSGPGLTTKAGAGVLDGLEGQPPA